MKKQSNPNEDVNVDTIIHKLLEGKEKNLKLLQTDIKGLCEVVREVLLQQPMLLELEAPVKIVGDVHGQYSDLITLFGVNGFPNETNYLFLGDYVDRGKQSIQCICLLLAYKVKYPHTIFLLRGNHQCSSINRIYGFYDECKRKYSLKIWKTFSDVFNVMPMAALIQDRIFCIHGGLSPDLQSPRQISEYSRPVEIQGQGLLSDILWSDPSNIYGWDENERGVSYTFGADVVDLFLKKNDLDLIVRAHQVVQQGYQFFAKRKLCTIFSAPNYCGQFDNSAAVMSIDQSLQCSFQVIKASNKKK